MTLYAPPLAALLALAALVPMPSLAADAAAAADVRAGLAADQSWVYQQPLEDGQVARVEVTTVYQTRGNDWVLAVRRAAAPVAAASAPDVVIHGTLDGQGCMVDLISGRRLQEPPCSAPAAGSTWTLPMGLAQRRTYKATGHETLTVPAGSLDTLRIEEADETEVVGLFHIHSQVQTARAVYWYAPQMAAMARVERDILRPDGSVAQHEVQVLESFGPASDESRAGIRATSVWQAWERARLTHLRIQAVITTMPSLSRKASTTMPPECKPEYPAAAVRAGVTGTTSVIIVVEADGSVQDSEVARPSGPTREHRLLDTAAQRAVTACRFTPGAAADGTPKASAVLIAYTWKLQ